MAQPDQDGRLNRAARSAASIFFEELPVEEEEIWPPDIYGRHRLEIITDEIDARCRAGTTTVEHLILTVGERSAEIRDLAIELARRNASARGDSHATVVIEPSFPRSRRRRRSGAPELREYASLEASAEADASHAVVVDSAEQFNRAKLGDSRVDAVIAISCDALDGAYARLLEDELKDNHCRSTVRVCTFDELQASNRTGSDGHATSRARRSSSTNINQMADALLCELNGGEFLF